MKRVAVPFDDNQIQRLSAGEEVLIEGVIYTARDQAHKKLVSMLNKGQELPLNLRNQVFYYCGPTPARPGRVIGSCGPTTSERMDFFVEELLKAGLKAMIGKGKRHEKVRKLIQKYKAFYFIAPAGCGALLSEKVISKKLVAFRELGSEAIYKLEVKEFPLIVGIDSEGSDVYKDKG